MSLTSRTCRYETLESRQMLNADPTLSVADSFVTEGDQFEVVLRLDTPAQQDVVVGYELRDGSAMQGEDYDGGRATVVIPRGEREVRLQHGTVENERPEPTEHLNVVVTRVEHAILSSPAPAMVTIVDDDEIAWCHRCREEAPPTLADIPDRWQNSDQRAAEDQLRDRHNDLLGLLPGMSQQVADAEEEVARSSEARQKAEQDLAERKAELTESDRRLASTAADLKAAEEAMNWASGELSARQKDYVVAEQGLQEARDHVAEIGDKIQGQRDRLTRQERRLDHAHAAKSDALWQLQQHPSATTTLQPVISRADRTIQDATTQIDDAKKQIENLEERLSDAESRLAGAEQTTERAAAAVQQAEEDLARAAASHTGIEIEHQTMQDQVRVAENAVSQAESRLAEANNSLLAALKARDQCKAERQTVAEQIDDCVETHQRNHQEGRDREAFNGEIGEQQIMNVQSGWKFFGYNSPDGWNKKSLIAAVGELEFTTVDASTITAPNTGVSGSQRLAIDKADIPSDIVVGVGGLDTCIGVMVHTPDGMLHIFHFTSCCNPGATLNQLEMPAGTKIAIAGGNGNRESNATIRRVMEALNGRNVEQLGYVDASGLYWDADSEQHVVLDDQLNG